MRRKIKALFAFIRNKGLIETFRKTYCTILKKPYLHKIPYYIHIELNNTCNFRCHMCPIHKMKREKKLMDFHVFRKIVDECAQVGVRRLRLFLMGEPLLHPRLVEYIKYAKSKGLFVDFDSNAGYLNKIDQEALILSGIDEIIFSVTGAKPETYKKFQGEDLSRVEKNIKDFVELKRKLKSKTPKISMQFIKSKDTSSEVSDYVKKWTLYSDGINITRLSDYFNPSDKSSLRKKFCPYLWTFLVILSDGSIVPCCQDYEGHLKLGNIKDTTLIDAWNSEKLNYFRKLHVNKEGDKIGLCKDCDVMYIKA